MDSMVHNIIRDNRYSEKGIKSAGLWGTVLQKEGIGCYLTYEK